MRKLNLYFLFLLFSQILSAQTAVDKFVNSDLLKNGNVSLLVRDLSTGKDVYAFRANNAAIPASTMKLVTTATALEMLGGDFTFKTQITYDGEISNGILTGNIYIEGSGDPTLGSEKTEDKNFLQKWAQQVKAKGIKEIKGNIVADGSLFETETANPKWMWEDMGNYYGAGVGAVSYRDNTYTVTLNSGARGTKPTITKVTPQIPELKFKNNLTSTAIKFDSAYIFGAPDSFERMINGEIPANNPAFEVKGSLPRPGLFLAKDFKNALREAGVKVIGFHTDNVPAIKPRKLIFTHSSPALRDIVKEINVNSNNHYAEHVFKRLSLQTDKKATTMGALSVIKNFWNGKLPVEQLFMYDGSGLSPLNAVSAEFFTDLLAFMNKSKNASDFKNSLPVAGATGTLRNVLDKTVLAGKVKAKSGTMIRVRCYAGYLDYQDKKWCFAILVNNAAGNARQVTTQIENFLLEITR